MTESIIKRVDAMWGEAEEARENIIIALKDSHSAIYEGVYNDAMDHLRKAISELETARLLSRWSRAKRDLREFRTLPILPIKLNEIKEAFEKFQGDIGTLRNALSDIANKSPRFTKNLGLTEGTKKNIKTLKRKLEHLLGIDEGYIQELFKLGKDIVDKIKAIPKIEDSYLDIITFNGEFSGNGLNILTYQVIVNKFIKKNSNPFIGLKFEKINFNSPRNLIAKMTFFKCKFINCSFSISTEQTKFNDCVFDNCKFEDFLLGSNEPIFNKCEFVNGVFNGCHISRRLSDAWTKQHGPNYSPQIGEPRVKSFCINSTFGGTNFLNCNNVNQYESLLFFGKGTICSNVNFQGCEKVFFDRCTLDNIKFLNGPKGLGKYVFQNSKITDLAIFSMSCNLISFHNCKILNSVFKNGRTVKFKISKCKVENRFGFENVTIEDFFAYSWKLGFQTWNKSSIEKINFSDCRVNFSGFIKFTKGTFIGGKMGIGAGQSICKLKFDECLFNRIQFSGKLSDIKSRTDWSLYNRATFKNSKFYSACNFDNVSSVLETNFVNCEGIQKKYLDKWKKDQTKAAA